MANEPRRKRAVPTRDKKGTGRQKLVLVPWFLGGGWWLELVVGWLSLLGRVWKDRRLVFTSACSGAREDPPELGRVIVARRCLDSARPRWCTVRTARRPHEVDRSEAGSGLQFASPFELEALIKTIVGPILLGVCVCVFVVPVC